MRAIALALSLAVLTGCAHGPRRGFDSRELLASLNRILAWHQRNAPNLAGMLQPGLSRAQIDELARKRKIVLPEEVYALYGWRDGTRDRKPFFDVYRMLPLAEAFEAGDILSEASPGGDYRLPVFQSILSNDGYDVLCSRTAAAQAPVEFFIDGGPSPDMDNLTTFSRALAASFEKGAFTVNRRGELDTDRPLMERIFLDYRPQRKADVEAVLRGDALKLPTKREMQAYGDLIQTENPRAEKLLSQAMSHWLHNPQARFEGLLQLAHLNTPGSLALLQQAALEPDFEGRRDVYSILAWQTRWERGQLQPALENVAILDLLNPLCRLCERREIARVLRWAPDKRPVSTLIAVLGSIDVLDMPCARDTRIAIALALGQLGDRSAVAPLLDRLSVETDPGTQLVLASALADLANAEGERKLRDRLQAMDENSLWNLADHADGRREGQIAKELYGRVRSGDRQPQK